MPVAIAPPPPLPIPVAPVTSKSGYGHLQYQEASQSQLKIVGIFVRGSYQRVEKLNPEAAAAFQRMAVAAQVDGIKLMPISGFRSVNSQQKLFDRQIERQGGKAAAAKLSAPPGHSEHHTGFALDIGEAQNPSTDLNMSFQSSGAYRWLVSNGGRYGFELSFPRENSQGVSFEPWHWRYVGSTTAQSIFKAAKGG